jgi:hypothetical protein
VTTLEGGVHAEAADAGEAAGVVELALGLEALALMLACDDGEGFIDVAVGEGIDAGHRKELAGAAEDRWRVDGEVEVGGAGVHHLAQ